MSEAGEGLVMQGFGREEKVVQLNLFWDREPVEVL